MAESNSRYATLSEEDLNLLLDDKDAKSTKRATKSALKNFHQYLKGKKADESQTKDTQNFPSVTQTIQSGRQLSQSLTSQVLKQGILWP